MYPIFLYTRSVTMGYIKYPDTVCTQLNAVAFIPSRQLAGVAFISGQCLLLKDIAVVH